jgi:hypothetical protein
MTEDTIQNENERLEAALAAEEAKAPQVAPESPPSNATAPDPAPKPAAAAPKKKAATKKPTPPRPIDSPTETRKGHDAARKAAIDQAVDDMPRPAEPSEAERAELERRAKLRGELDEIQSDLEKTLEKVDALKHRAREIMGEIYPHQVASDRPVDAVRGFLKASREERATRGAHPARLKELLLRAGKAPIDAAFMRARGRGTQRPSRSATSAQAPAATDQAKGATPGAKE